jgi:hypothetical protein
MRTHNEIANRRLYLLENMMDFKKQKIKKVTQLAREMGIGAQTQHCLGASTMSSSMKVKWASSLLVGLKKG